MAAPPPSLDAGVLLAGPGWAPGTQGPAWPSQVPSGYRHPCCEGLILALWKQGRGVRPGLQQPQGLGGGNVGTHRPPAAQSSTRSSGSRPRGASSPLPPVCPHVRPEPGLQARPRFL